MYLATTAIATPAGLAPLVLIVVVGCAVWRRRR
jgi:MYXO-CTERM domain-containing protein